MFLLQISVKKETQQTYKFKAGRIKCTWKFGKKELTRRVSIEDLFPLKSLNFPGHQQYETPMHLESVAWTPNDQLRGLERCHLHLCDGPLIRKSWYWKRAKRAKPRTELENIQRQTHGMITSDGIRVEKGGP